MLALLLSSLVSVFLFIVFGTFAAKVARLPANFTEKLLVGLVISNTLSSILSLFFAVDGYVLLGLIILCVCLGFFVRQELSGLFYMTNYKKSTLLFSLPFILVAFIISLNAPGNYDTGLYHIQAIKWIETFPIVPGLANLHGRFGFDPNIFTFFALSSMSGLFGQEIFSVNFTVFAVLTVYFIGLIRVLYKEKGISNILVFFLIAFLTLILLYDNLSSPSPDFLSIAVPLFILVRMIDLSAQKDTITLKNFYPVIILCGYILTTKMATLPAMLLAVFVVFKYKTEAKKLIWLIPLLGFIILPWLIRNVILTGWLIYPFPSLNLFSFDWQVPITRVIIEKETVTGWARSPNAHYALAAKMAFTSWFPVWWHQLSLFSKILFVGGLCSPLAVFIWQLIKKVNIGYFVNAVVATSFAGVIFWLFLAPELRFGEAFIVVAAITPLFAINFNQSTSAKPLKLFMPLILVLLCIQLITGRHYIISAAHQISSLIVKPQIIQSPANLKFKTYKMHGVVIYAPANSDKCFCHAIPCLPHIDTAITLRDNQLSDGFRMK